MTIIILGGWRLVPPSSWAGGDLRPLHARCDLVCRATEAALAVLAVLACAASDTTALQAHVDEYDCACAVVRRALCFRRRMAFVRSHCMAT